MPVQCAPPDAFHAEEASPQLAHVLTEDAFLWCAARWLTHT
jgi:hypothetical protein